MSGQAPNPVSPQPSVEASGAAADPSDLAAGAAGDQAAGGPGAQLMHQRRAQGLSLGDIARQLKLSVRQVEALERDDYRAFAGMVFVRGFLRNYAKLLQVDPEPLLAMTASEAVPAPPVQPAAPLREARAPWLTLPGRGWLLAALVLAALVVAALLESRRNQGQAPAPTLPPAPLASDAPSAPPAQTETSPAQPALHTAQPGTPPAPPETRPAQPATPPAQPATHPGQAGTPPAQPGAHTAQRETAPAAPAAPAAQAPATQAITPMQPAAAVSAVPEQQVRLIFDGPAWVEIKDATGAVIFSQLSDTGAQRTVSGTPPLALVIGNAHAVRVSFREQPVDLAPHTRVDVARLVLE
jgi:cytoskeleton protein RodZ